MVTYKELLQNAKDILKEQKIADADVDAWYLLAHVFGMKRTDLIVHGDDEVSEVGCEQYLKLINQRAQHIPLQHLTGTQEFMGLEFEVNKHVLIPRQDTETLVEEVLKFCNGKSVLDMCTGSGCIIISLAKLGSITKAVGADISVPALETAERNAKRNQVDIEFIQSDLFDHVRDSYDVIVSNPPYIPTGDIEDLMPEVKDFEPYAALDGAEDGLLFYRIIISNLKKHLKPGGWVFFEIGHNQGEAVRKLLLNAGFFDVNIKKDLSGHDRVVSAKDFI